MATTILVLALTLIIGIALAAAGLFASYKLAEKDQEVACAITAIVSIIAGSIIAVLAAGTITSVLEKVIIYRTLSTEVIRVLDHHGLDNFCENFDCKGLTNGAALEGLEGIPGLEFKAGVHPSERN